MSVRPLVPALIAAVIVISAYAVASPAFAAELFPVDGSFSTLDALLAAAGLILGGALAGAGMATIKRRIDE